jgi:hypothetical protein
MAAIKKSSMRLWIKLLAGSMAFLPMALYFLVGAFFAGRVPSNHIVHYIVVGSALFNFPAFSILALVKTYHVSKVFELLSLVGLMLLWSSIIAWVFWRIASTFLGEDEPDYETNPDGAKFDWVGFRVRFVIGFIIGFLVGWRFVLYSANMATFLITMVLTGLFVGLAFGLYRPNFWKRP